MLIGLWAEWEEWVVEMAFHWFFLSLGIEDKRQWIKNQFNISIYIVYINNLHVLFGEKDSQPETTTTKNHVFYLST